MDFMEIQSLKNVSSHFERFTDPTIRDFCQGSPLPDKNTHNLTKEIPTVYSSPYIVDSGIYTDGRHRDASSYSNPCR